jgi:hypothetical protein
MRLAPVPGKGRHASEQLQPIFQRLSKIHLNPQQFGGLLMFAAKDETSCIRLKKMLWSSI